jgi:hypothetical protein
MASISYRQLPAAADTYEVSVDGQVFGTVTKYRRRFIRSFGSTTMANRWDTGDRQPSYQGPKSRAEAAFYLLACATGHPFTDDEAAAITGFRIR